MNITTFSQQYSWLIVALPIVSFLLIGLTIVVSGETQALARRIAPWILILALLGALVVAGGTLLGTMNIAPTVVNHEVSAYSPWPNTVINWMTPEPVLHGIDHTLKVGLLLDPLSTVMLFVVVLVSLLVQIYSFGYMKREEHPRFYLYMSLFTASMLGLVISSTLLQLFIFWELVGLCSYLLIGFWYTKPEAARAAIKAFVVTRFGDLGLLIAVIALWMKYGDLSFSNLSHQIGLGNTAGLPLPLVAIAILLFIGACGKSAQFPLHIWLPDAMEGPTSVSALIHAATMVAAGVFLVARMFFLFEAAPASLLVVALVGTFTAFFAASIGLAQNDMKKVMAYSTISQLGYMMMGLGLAAPAAAFFHLTTHAFFKALLFLTAGSVIHAAHTQDMREMGGLFSKMKVTAITCLIGGLALAGIFPLAGFFSKDKLLESALAVALGHGSAGAAAVSPGIAWLILLMALATVLMTAFYTARMWVLVFLGKPRSHGAEHAHESPGSMKFSLVVLAALTCVVGFILVPHLTSLVGHESEELSQSLIWSMTGVASLLAIFGIVAGYRVYAKAPATEPLRKLGWIYTGMVNLWYVDAFFTWLARRVVLVLAGLIARFDKGVIDGGLVDGTAWLLGRSGVKIRRLSAGPLPGQLQYYALIIFAIAALIICVMASRDYLHAASLLGGLGR